MDPNINNNSMHSSAGTTADHFFPFDPLPSFLDSPAFPPTSTWAPPDPSPAIAPTATTPPAAVGTTGASRPSKKRSRASRRAPTTVLTTDTSNFRAMVQEFTGIPSPPFPTSAATSASSLHFPRFRHFLQTPSSSSSPPGPLPPLNFQSLLHSQLLNLPQQPHNSIINPSTSSGELRLPGVIGSGGDTDRLPNKLNFPVPAAEFSSEKGGPDGREGLMESWICSSD